jgi:CelD/BcsL family acetyltransferase involved in cellulose biosynthesis
VPIALSGDPQDFVARDWSGLVRADPSGTFFHTPRYLKLYWEEFGQDIDLRIALAEEGDRTVGAGAFEIEGDTLWFLGGTEVTDYMGPVAVPGAGDAVAKELMEALAGLDSWRRADLRGLPEDSPWLPRLRDAAGAQGLAVEDGEDSVAPMLELPGSYEEYLAGLPAKLRHEIRRKARRLDQETGGHRLVHADPDTLARDLGLFVAMHRSSEGPKGKFMKPGMEIFFRRLAEAFLDEGIFRLAFVEAAGRKMAGAIALVYAGTTYMYNSAFDHRYRDLAPGMVLVADLIEQACRERCERFDMLKGDLAYKYRFGARPRLVRRLALSRG